METTLKIYDQFDEFLTDVQLRRISSIPLNNLASEFMDNFGYQDEEDLHFALMRTFEVCCAIKIPIEQHFRKIYRSQGGSLIIDWQLSDFASCLLLINGNSRNPNVAKAQLQYLAKVTKH